MRSVSNKKKGHTTVLLELCFGAPAKVPPPKDKDGVNAPAVFSRELAKPERIKESLDRAFASCLMS